MSWWNGKSEAQERGETLQKAHNEGQAEADEGNVPPHGLIERVLTVNFEGREALKKMDEENEAYSKGRENARNQE